MSRRRPSCQSHLRVVIPVEDLPVRSDLYQPTFSIPKVDALSVLSGSACRDEVQFHAGVVIPMSNNYLALGSKTGQ
jgi:hypothetical protein